MMSHKRLALLALLACTAAAPTAHAQTSRRVTVVQIAGANLYLNVGTDSGVAAGDTLQARRGGTGNLLGAFQVVTATPTRSVVTFLGAPFSVTRGDTLFVTLGRGAAAVIPAPAPLTARAAAPGPRRLTSRSSGAIGFEINGARTTTLGLGADPARSTEDYATPAVRFRWGLDNPSSGTGLSLNVVATHRAGPVGLFDEATAVRIYEARFDQGIGHNSARISIGRFLSNFDHSSGYWDGAMLRIGSERGLSVGFAGGFEPDRVNETFNADAPKYAAFVNLRVGRPGLRYRSDVAFHQMLPSGLLPKQSVGDWNQRLDAGGFHLGNDLEVGQDPLTGQWNVSRFQARLSASVTATNEFYATVVSDKPTPIDTTSFGLVLQRRERATVGFSHRSGKFYSDLDFTVNSPLTTTSRGEAAGLSFGISGRKLTLSGSASYFTFPESQGVFASPGIEYRFGGVRARISYQFLLSEGTLYSVKTHGGDLTLGRALSSRVDWMTRVNVRYGDNVRGVGIYSSLDVRF